MCSSLRIVGLGLLGAAVALTTEFAASADESNRAGIDFFERKIRPLLAQNCYECHGSEKQKGLLRLDSRAAILTGGETGPALVPGQPEESRLIKGVSYADSDFQMPPKKRLSERQVADLREWIKLGAPWPESVAGDDAGGPAPRLRAGGEVTEEDRAWWAFRPIQRPEVPGGQKAGGGSQESGVRSRESRSAESIDTGRTDANAPATTVATPSPLNGERAGVRILGSTTSRFEPLNQVETPNIEHPTSNAEGPKLWADLDVGRWRLNVERFEGVSIGRSETVPNAQDNSSASKPLPATHDRPGDQESAHLSPKSSSPVPELRTPNSELPSPISHLRNPIDSFILAELSARNLTPNPPATKRELIRRAYFDLIGLPPTYEQVRAFERDPSPNAYEQLVDQLLSLPQYGERWGRHWLDVVRFAQTTGYERDAEKPLTWRYRDYVINAFNGDKPYDQFIKEQLAGDELPEAGDDSIIATGFYRLGVHDDEPADKQMAIFDEYDDYIATTGAAFLGLTLGCARCHDHKFDPIPQADYYSLLAFFRGIRGYESPKFTLDSAAFIPLAKADQVREWQTQLEAKLKPVEEQLAAAKTTLENARQMLKQSQADAKKLEHSTASENSTAPLTEKLATLQTETKDLASKIKGHAEEQRRLEQQIEQIRNEKAPWDWALAAKEKGGQPDPTHILVRGNPLSPAAEVQPAFLSALSGPTLKLESGRSHGRRLALAHWIASADNPLTARVLVNRVWKHHFGRGLVKTTTDFGRAGTLPTHPRLLDWLAAEFISSGWSIKKLHKTIMLSETYRRSSRTDNDPAGIDPANDFLWRQNLHRLEAEAIRDTVLSVSGKLNLKPGGRGFFPRLAGEVIAGASRPGLDWEVTSEDEESRRSVYTFVKRTMLAPSLQSFDYSTTDSPLGERPTTTVAPQSLLLLNDGFMQKQAAAFAGRLAREAGGDGLAFQVRRAYQLALARDPTLRESELALDLIEKQARGFDQISRRLTFRPDVPESLYNAYQDKLRPEDHLIGPRDGWSYHRGDWSKDYEGIRTMDRVRGPFALWTGAEFADGTIEAKLMLHRAVEFASLLFRSSATHGVQRGYELALDARQQKLILRRHTTNVVTLAEATATIRVTVPQWVKVEARDAQIRVWFDGAATPAITAVDPDPITSPGRVGIRAWGSAMSLDELTLNTGGRTFNATETIANAPKRVHERALEALCLTLLNLNEFVYVD